MDCLTSCLPLHIYWFPWSTSYNCLFVEQISRIQRKRRKTLVLKNVIEDIFSVSWTGRNFILHHCTFYNIWWTFGFLSLCKNNTAFLFRNSYNFLVTWGTYCSAAGHPCSGRTVTGQGSPGIRTQVRGCTTVWSLTQDSWKVACFTTYAFNKGITIQCLCGKMSHIATWNNCLRHNYTMSMWKDVAYSDME